MINSDIFKALIPLVQRSDTPRAASSRYSVLNGGVPQVVTILESTQEQRETPLIESYNQQQIFIWVRNNLKNPSVQGHGYTEWELSEARERKILDNSSYSYIIENLGYQNLC